MPVVRRTGAETASGFAWQPPGGAGAEAVLATGPGDPVVRYGALLQQPI
ncbi:MULTISPECIES: hypothetical protein [unclassified Actinoplanes]|nr:MULTISPECIES: hypothetical protein [unclassified Actinoplanes]